MHTVHYSQKHFLCNDIKFVKVCKDKTDEFYLSPMSVRHIKFENPDFSSFLVLYFHSVDINECSMPPTLCAENAHCLNTAGSYVCECNQGYSGDSYTNCTGMDYC